MAATGGGGGGGWGGATSGSSEDPGVSGEQLRRTGLPKTPGAVDSGLGKVRGYRGLRHRDLGGQGPSHCPVPSSPGSRLDASSALAWRPLPGPSPAVSRGSHGRSLEAALLAVGPSPVPPSVNQQPRGAGPETTDGSVRPDGADRGTAARRPGELGAAPRCPPPPHTRQGPGTSASLRWGALPPPGSSGLPEAPRCGSAIPNRRRRPTRDACRGEPSATRRLARAKPLAPPGPRGGAPPATSAPATGPPPDALPARSSGPAREPVSTRHPGECGPPPTVRQPLPRPGLRQGGTDLPPTMGEGGVAS